MVKKKFTPIDFSKRKSRTPTSSRIMIMLSVLFSVPFLLPSYVFLMFALAPTVVAALVEKGEYRYAWLCVGGTNVAGAAPYFFDLWARGHTLATAVGLLLDMSSMLIVYSAAAAGWMLYLGVPPVVGIFLGVISKRRIATLKAIQKKLVEEWGPQIAEAAKSSD
jgi:hypothetical protein